MLHQLQTRPLDAEYVGLLHNIQSEETPGYIFRGYGLLRPSADGNTAELIGKDIRHYNGLKRPVVWVFSGMGSQWTEMGASLMEIPMFRSSIEQCHKVLKPYGLDLISIITANDKTMFDNILHSFVGIAAIQIALCDILKALDIPADYYIGHSVGELGCAYADGCFSAEQMILAAYSRGMASLETKKIRGSMAAVGLSFNQIRHRVPSNIDVACHNGPDSCTISGPEADIAKFVAELKSKGIFAKEVSHFLACFCYFSRSLSMCLALSIYLSLPLAYLSPSLILTLSLFLPLPHSNILFTILSSFARSNAPISHITAVTSLIWVQIYWLV